MQITQDDPPQGGSVTAVAEPPPDAELPEAATAPPQHQREPPWYQRAMHSIRFATMEFGTWVTSGLQVNLLPTRVTFRVLLATLLLLGILTSAGGAAVTAISDYTTVRGLATSGLDALKRLPGDLGLNGHAADPGLSREAMQRAADTDIAIALHDFQALHDRLANPDFVLAAAAKVPKFAAQLRSAYLLSALALDGAHIAQQTIDGLVPVVSALETSPLLGKTGSDGPALTTADIQSLQDGITASLPYFTDILQTVQTTAPDVLLAALSASQRSEVTPWLKSLPQLVATLPFIQQLLAVAPTALGVTQPTAYLLMTLDSAEMRPGGGFQGNYGVVGVNDGQISAIALQDVYLLDKPFQKTTAGSADAPPDIYSNWWPTSYLPWGLRDANLSADFPTNAQYDLSQLRQEGGAVVPILNSAGQIIRQQPVNVGGVIAIEPEVIKQILTLTGPVTIPAPYNITVTPDNLESMIHYYQLTSDGRNLGNQVDPGQQVSSPNKRFTALLAHALENRLKSLSKSDLLKLAQTLLNDLVTKDIQMYFTDPHMEGLLQSYQVSAALYTGTADALMIDDANISGNKGSQYLTEHVSDVVQLDAQGGATHTMTITYDWAPPPIQDGADPTQVYSVLYNADTSNDFGLYYRQYVRIYTAANPSVFSASGWQGGGIETTQSDIPGRGMIGAHYILRGDATTHPVSWTVPQVMLTWHVANVFTPGQEYHLFFQRQAGSHVDYSVTILPPVCSGVTATNASPLKTAHIQGSDQELSAVVPPCAR
jgi:hypothetical protein